MTELRAAIYTRVSTESQDGEDKTSLIEQVGEIEAYASAKDYTIVARYQDIDSGVKRDRPGFLAMQADARRGSFDIVLAWKADRLARSGSAMGDLLDATEPHKVGVETISGAFDLRYAELLASIGRMERQSIAERMELGKMGAARQGRIPSGKPPYGYRIGEDRKPVIMEFEAEAIRRMFDLYVSARMGTPSIRATLEREFGYRVSAAHIYNLLTQRAYIGTYAYRSVEIPCPPIVDRELFDRAQAVKKERLIRGLGNTKVHYLLQHLIKCEGCGRMLGARTRREGPRVHRYYHCYGFTSACRKHPYINADDLEARVWSEISAVLKRPDLLSAKFNETADTGSLAEDIEGAGREVAKWDRRNGRLVSLFVGESITKTEFDHQRKFITEPLEAAQERLTVL